MADATTEIDLDSVIDRLLEGEYSDSRRRLLSPLQSQRAHFHFGDWMRWRSSVYVVVCRLLRRTPYDKSRLDSSLLCVLALFM